MQKERCSLRGIKLNPSNIAKTIQNNAKKMQKERCSLRGIKLNPSNIAKTLQKQCKKQCKKSAAR